MKMEAGGLGTVVAFRALSRLDSQMDLEYYRHGGVLPMMVRRLLTASQSS